MRKPAAVSAAAWPLPLLLALCGHSLFVLLCVLPPLAGAYAGWGLPPSAWLPAVQASAALPEAAAVALKAGPQAVLAAALLLRP